MATWLESPIFVLACVILLIPLTLISILLYRLYHPKIISYPWPQSTREESSSQSSLKKTRVIFAGSFNPPHRGHLAMVEYLSRRHSEVVLVVGVNPNKTYDVSPQQRADLLNTMIKSLTSTTATAGSGSIRVAVVQGYIWRYAKSINAQVFYRGIRTWTQDGRDEQSLATLNTWGPIVYGPLTWPVPTVYLEGVPDYRAISSTRIRELIHVGGERMTGGSNDGDSEQVRRELERLVPSEIVSDVARLYH